MRRSTAVSTFCTSSATCAPAVVDCAATRLRCTACRANKTSR
jgi:hypothetical protein